MLLDSNMQKENSSGTEKAVKTCVKVYEETTITNTVKSRTVGTNRSRK
jgi:hypothetical protein